MLVFVVVFEVGFCVADLEGFAIFFGTDFVVVFVADFEVDLFVADLEVDFVVDFVLFVGVCFFALGSVLYSPKRESLAPTFLPKSPNSSWNLSFMPSSSFISCFISLISCRFPKSISFVIESTCVSN